jgi:hypothetical protein
LSGAACTAATLPATRLASNRALMEFMVFPSG